MWRAVVGRGDVEDEGQVRLGQEKILGRLVLHWGWSTGSVRPGSAAPKIIKYFIYFKQGFANRQKTKQNNPETRVLRLNKDGAFRKQKQVFPKIVLCEQMQDDDDAQMQCGMMT